jgi:phage protein D/phage baseplate assembly protein gpV
VPDRRSIDTPALTVNGRPLSAELYPRLRLVRVEESVQLPDSVTLRFEDAHFELFDSGTFHLGSTLDVAVRAEEDPTIIAEVEVTAMSVEPGAGGRHELVVTALDRAHRLGRSPRTRTFQHMSDAAIARQIAGEYGLDASVSSGGTAHDYVLQARQTDGEFLSDRAARIGYDWWVTGKTLHFAPQPVSGSAPPKLVWGQNLQSFRVRFSAADRCDEVVVHGWDGLGKKALTGTSSDTDFGTDARAAQSMADAAKDAFGRVRRETGRVGVTDQSAADDMALSLIRRTSGAEVVLHGVAIGDPRLAAGATVQLEQIGSSLSGSYRITSVEHTLGGDIPYTTRFVCGAKDSGNLVDLIRPAKVLSPNGAGQHEALGLVVAQVTNNDDKEGLGRVKVKFLTLSQEDESTWARAVSAGAGNARGMQWTPEVGDEVLVGFEYGDVHRPVVLGSMWSRTDPAPEQHAVSSGKTDVRVLASRKNHRLELTDGPTSKIRLSLGDSECSVVLAENESSLKGKKKLIISADQLEISATQKLVLKAPQVEISADSTLTATGHPIKLN